TNRQSQSHPSSYRALRYLHFINCCPINSHTNRPRQVRSPVSRRTLGQHYSMSLDQVNCSFVVAASGSQPRDGLLLIEETSLMEIWRPRVFGPFTSTSDGLQVC